MSVRSFQGFPQGVLPRIEATVLEEGSADRERMRAIRTKMTIPPVIDDVAAMLAFIDRQGEVKRGPVGCHGYCMSGPYALAAAARYSDRITAAASFYGTWLVSDAKESPHLSLAKVEGELYIACAEHDALAPLPMVEKLRTLFSRAGTIGEIELYPASITASPSRSAGITTSRRRSSTGSG